MKDRVSCTADWVEESLVAFTSFGKQLAADFRISSEDCSFTNGTIISNVGSIIW